MTKYIIMNKEENRIQVGSGSCTVMWSGQIDLIISTTPKVYTSKVKACMKAWCYGGKVKELKVNSFTKPIIGESIWCYVTGGEMKGELIKVGTAYEMEKSYTLSYRGGFIENLQGDDIYCHDFVEVTFK